MPGAAATAKIRDPGKNVKKDDAAPLTFL